MDESDEQTKERMATLSLQMKGELDGLTPEVAMAIVITLACHTLGRVPEGPRLGLAVKVSDLLLYVAAPDGDDAPETLQ